MNRSTHEWMEDRWMEVEGWKLVRRMDRQTDGWTEGRTEPALTIKGESHASSIESTHASQA